jgi:hypothetical protein
MSIRKLILKVPEDGLPWDGIRENPALGRICFVELGDRSAKPAKSD